MPPPPPLVPDERQSQTQDSNDEEVEEINREPYEPRMNHSGEINPSIPLPVQQTLYQISQDEVCYHQLYFCEITFFQTCVYVIDFECAIKGSA